MQGPHFEHLTNSYVEALGLKPFLHERDETWAVVIPGQPPVPMRAFDFAVVYNHGLYLREEPDGLAWTRKP